jgi:hypothetical protein
MTNGIERELCADSGPNYVAHNENLGNLRYFQTPASTLESSFDMDPTQIVQCVVTIGLILLAAVAAVLCDILRLNHRRLRKALTELEAGDQQERRRTKLARVDAGGTLDDARVVARELMGRLG